MVPQQKRSQFIVRALREGKELEACADLEHAYTTDTVWQMDARTDHDEAFVRFRTVRLPRPIHVAYPRERHSLLQAWQQRDCFLVAVAEDIVLGYVNMRVDDTGTKGWIHDLVVSEPVRHRGIGSALLEQATRWAYLRKLEHLTIETPTKNYPAIRFALAHGFTFCGFNDHYYTNQDIALFFGKAL